MKLNSNLIPLLIYYLYVLFNIAEGIDFKKKSQILFSLVKLVLNLKTINPIYLSDICKKRKFKADTIRKYMTSLGDFCKFLVAEEQEVPNISNAEISVLKEKIEIWSKRYRKASKARFWERAEEDYEMLVTPEQIDEYENSVHDQSAIKLFGIYSSSYCTHHLNLKDYCIMKDYLLSKIHFSTGHRSGVTTNMTLKEYGKAHIQDDGTFIINFAATRPLIHTGMHKLL